MGSLNRVILVGNLGKDAEVTSTTGGTTVARFSMATSYRRRDQRTNEWVAKTEWHRIVVWGKLAESVSEYLRKGKEVAVEGRIETRSWEDRDGNKRYMTEIIADSVQLLGRRPSGDHDTAREERPARHEEPQPAESQHYDDDDVPF